VIRLAVLAALAPGQPAPAQDPAYVALAELSGRLSAAKSGNYSFELVRECRPANPADLPAMQEYVRQAAARCWGGQLAATNARLPEDNARLVAERGGTALAASMEPPPNGRLIGTLTVDGTQCSLDTFHQPAPGRIVRESFRYSENERVHWSVVDGVRRATSRLDGPEHTQPLPPGTPMEVQNFERRALALLGLPRSEPDEATTDDGHSRLVRHVSLDSWEARDALQHPLNPGHGVRELPGRVILSADFEGGRAMSLGIEYEYCLGGTLLEERIAWPPTDAMPRELVRRRFAPGLEVVVEEEFVRLSPAETDANAPALEWHPEPGETIVDERFGRAVTYTADAEGAIPTEPEIRARAGTRNGAAIPVSPLRPVAARLQAGPATEGPSNGPRPWIWAGAGLAVILVGALLRSRRP